MINPAPHHFLGVMVSSTFTDLEKHRAILIKAIKGQGLTDVAMENDSAKPDVDVIDSSLQMVADASAYVAIISHKYGQAPVSPDRNPNELSITELEFIEAQRLQRPILLFIMGDAHDVHKVDVEIDPVKIKKLNEFRERAKQMKRDSKVHRVYATFDSLEEFSSKVSQAVAVLHRYLDEQNKPAVQTQTTISALVNVKLNPMPAPPAFYAEPPYIGSHEFIGRQAQLDVLDDWALAADSHPILLFDAIGGSGKSMLTWKWITNHSSNVRDDWAGRVWYSFYERGAVMADFCRCTLAYITGNPLEEFKKMKTLELSDLLVHHLRARPWLLVLDGLERILVAYHRFDAAQIPDEAVNNPTDQIAHRDPCAAINPEDDDLLRALCAAGPSKMLITSRLIPRALLNPASQPIPGVRRESLPGLLPSDAESLLRSCEITGDSKSIQNYLKNHCDCHPLVTGILAGLINDYLPNKGNFNAWVADPAGGGKLNFSNLNLVQKRNHILKVALDILSKESLELLSILSLLSEAVDYITLTAFNPYLPPKPEKTKTLDIWERLQQEKLLKDQGLDVKAVLLEEEKQYEQALNEWHQLPEVINAPKELAKTVRELEQRGLLQYDRQSKRYDLHPVVRGIVAGALRKDESELYGQRVVDYFSQQTHDPYDEAETLEDVRIGIHIVVTLLRMERSNQAIQKFLYDLSEPLLRNLEAYAEVLRLIYLFFPNGWDHLPEGISKMHARSLSTTAARALNGLFLNEESLAVSSTRLISSMEDNARVDIIDSLICISVELGNLNRFAKDDYYRQVVSDFASLYGSEYFILETKIRRYRQLSKIGRWEESDQIWETIDPRSSVWTGSSDIHKLEALYFRALSYFWRGVFLEEDLNYCEEFAKSIKRRGYIRDIHILRGEYYLEQGKWALAVSSLSKAVHLARMAGINDAVSETVLIIAKFHDGQLLDIRQEIERLVADKKPFHRGLAELWLIIGNQESANYHALLAYKKAWADGEPYVDRYELNKAIVLLEKLGVEVPNLPPYDPNKDEKFPWEEKLLAYIEKYRLEKNAKESNEKDQ